MAKTCLAFVAFFATSVLVLVHAELLEEARPAYYSNLLGNPGRNNPWVAPAVDQSGDPDRRFAQLLDLVRQYEDTLRESTRTLARRVAETRPRGRPFRPEPLDRDLDLPSGRRDDFLRGLLGNRTEQAVPRHHTSTSDHGGDPHLDSSEAPTEILSEAPTEILFMGGDEQNDEQHDADVDAQEEEDSSDASTECLYVGEGPPTPQHDEPPQIADLADLFDEEEEVCTRSRMHQIDLADSNGHVSAPLRLSGRVPSGSGSGSPILLGRSRSLPSTLFTGSSSSSSSRILQRHNNIDDLNAQGSDENVCCPGLRRTPTPDLSDGDPCSSSEEVSFLRNMIIFTP